MPSLFVIRGNDQGVRFELDDSLVRLGRDASNAIQLHDTEVSRHHAEIRLIDRAFSLADLGSSNGTFVNGRRVDRHPLQSGDQVQLGGTLMLFTGPSGETDDDLEGSVLLDRPDDASQIVHAVSQEEGSRIFDERNDIPQHSWLARARSNLQVMYRTALAVSHTLDIDQLLNRIMELIFEWVEADRGCIMLVDADAKKLVPKVRRTREGIRRDEKITISKTILDYVTQRNEGVLTSDAREDDRFSPAASILQLGVREAICVPMQGRYDMVGVIYIDTSTTPQEMVRHGGGTKFSQDHLKLMVAIAHQAALAVEDTRYYSAMVQAERLAAMGQTIATLSHHIKNILQGIRGGSYLIEMGLSEHDDEVIGKGWRIVEKNQNKISQLVLDMLTFSKEREPDLAVADLNQVIGDVIELMQSRAAEFQVELHWHPVPDMPQLVFDPEGIHRAVLNIVTNAIDAVSENGGEQPGRVDVRMGLTPQQDHVRIAVQDNGPGIPADQMDKLFSPFISSKKGRGTGLGLPVSQKILSEHGGRIHVDNKPGRGARFILEMPAVRPEPGAQTGEHATSGGPVSPEPG
ncbi:MAG: ATP-binding protein [Patescibacteria group bacterium]|nr:ATP-binding protein [Patescibacteria group bacterium]